MVGVMMISARLLMNGLYPFSVLIIELPLISGLISGFTPTMIWFISNNIIPQWRLPSVCTAMSIRLPSYLSSLVSFTCYIESSKSYIHTIIYSCTHTFIHTYIHAYKHSCTYNLHTIIILHWPLIVIFQLYLSKVSSPNVYGPEMSPIVLFGRILSVQSSLTFWTRLIPCQYLLCLLDQVNPLPIPFIPFGPG